MSSDNSNNFIFITNNSFPLGMALSNRILSLSLGMIKNGHAVTVLCIRPTEVKGDNRIQNPIEGIFEGIHYKYSFQNVRSNSFFKRRTDDFFGILFTFVYLIKRLVKHKSEIVFFGNSFIFEVLLSIFAKIFGVFVIKEESEIPSIYFRNKSFPMFRFNVYTHIIPRMFSLNAVMTDNLMDFFVNKSIPQKKIIKLPNAIDVDLFEKRAKLFKIESLPNEYIAFSGSLSNKKDGVLTLIEAFNNLSSCFRELNLVLMGAGNEKELKEIQVLIDKYNLQSKVKFLGKVNSSYVPYVLCNAKVLVSLRPPSSQAFYGFPTKIIEYLLSGKPVVTSITGELNKYMIDKENCFITTGSKDNVIETIQLVLADNILANRIGANGRNLVLKEFNAETIAQTFVKQCIQNKH